MQLPGCIWLYGKSAFGPSGLGRNAIVVEIGRPVIGVGSEGLRLHADGRFQGQEAETKLQQCFRKSVLRVHSCPKSWCLPDVAQEIPLDSVDNLINMSVQQRSTPGAGGETLHWQVVMTKVTSIKYESHLA